MRIIARMNMGGPAVQISGLMRQVDSTLFDHRLYTGFCDKDEIDYLESVATDITAIRIKGLGRRVSLIEDLKAFVFLVIEIRRFKPHVIHTHTAKAGFLGRIASIISMQPSIRIHTFHGHLLFGYFGPFKRSLVVFAEKMLALRTHQLLTVGKQVCHDLMLAGIGSQEKFQIMPPGLTIGQLPSNVESRDSLGLNTNRLQCAFIGRVTQIKRPDRFLSVVAEIKKRGIDLDFFIAGNGELLETCRIRIFEELLPVVVLGWQSDIEKVLSASDIVLLTSDNEGTPLSLIQAGMAGLPVVTTNVGSVPEIVRNGVTGIITSQDVQEIADALEKLTLDETLRLEFGANGQKFTSVRFGLRRLVQDHEELYLRLVSHRFNTR
jgi:glycosyltransferase involved in cell wall biosynthesis